jgi:signal peptidase I
MKKLIRDNRGLLTFVLLFGLFRTAVADWNPIPSGSMHPTLLEGDVVFVNRLAYSVKVPLTDIVLLRTGEPKRGDIVTFTSPADGRRLIKRVIALPGDVVEMRDKRLVINGQPADYRFVGAASEAAGGAALPSLSMEERIGKSAHLIHWIRGAREQVNFGPRVIPDAHYLMLGDNRDNSADSRYFGLVPRRLLIGRAERVLVSVAIDDDWRPRFSRFGANLR